MKARPFADTDPATFGTVIGCDEVGVGAWCGPVVAAAVWFVPAAIPPDLLAALDDSKRLSTGERERLAALIPAHASVAVSARSAAVIDRDGLRRATHAAMTTAVADLRRDDRVIVDGKAVPETLGHRAEALVRADRLVPQVAAASIMAKTVRDRAMNRLGKRHPAYGWASNVGYGTAQHREALTRDGPCRHHRLSYAPIKAAIVHLDANGLSSRTATSAGA